MFQHIDARLLLRSQSLPVLDRKISKGGLLKGDSQIDQSKRGGWSEVGKCEEKKRKQ